jgi:predicted nucleic acid-binding protein
MASHAWHNTMALAEKHRLTVYDATYLELSLRRGLPLATFDAALRRAAAAAGAKLL